MKNDIERACGMKRFFSDINDVLKAIVNSIAEILVEFCKMLAQSMGLISDVISNNILTEIISTALDKSMSISLQREVGAKKEELDSLVKYIDEKQKDAKRWELLVGINKELANALTTEIRDNIRKELDKNKTRKRIFKFISWLITLMLGAIVGALISKYLIY